MNQPANQQSNEPLIPAPQAGSIEDAIMGDTPNQIEIDKDFSEKIINAITPEGEEKPDGNSDDVANSESNNDEYAPAKEFTDLLNKEIAADDQSQGYQDQQRRDTSNPPQADLSVLRELLVDNPHMAPAVKEALAKQGVNLDAPGDPATMQRLDGMQGTINELVSMISSDRNMIMDNQVHNDVNDVYLDVVKDVPKHGRTLTDFFNNALVRDLDLKDISREVLENSNKAVTAELDNYFNSRLKSEGYSKSTGVPPSMNSRNAALTPPPPTKEAQSADPRNRPMNAFDEVDKDFARKVNNLFSQ